MKTWLRCGCGTMQNSCWYHRESDIQWWLLSCVPVCVFKNSFWFCFKLDTRGSRVRPSSSPTPRWWCQLAAPPCPLTVSTKALPRCSKHHWHGPERISGELYVSDPALCFSHSEVIKCTSPPPPNEHPGSKSYKRMSFTLVFFPVLKNKLSSLGHPNIALNYPCLGKLLHPFFPHGAHRMILDDCWWIF
jgi:hypothetical protein